MKVALKQPIARHTTSLKKVRELFILSNRISDLAENILEERGEYSDEFLASLARAEADVKAGRVHTIESLDELLKS